MSRIPNGALSLKQIDRLGQIEQFDRACLLQCWKTTFGSNPPNHLSIGFMRKALAYQWQCHREGGLPKRVQKQLLSIAAGSNIDDALPTTIQSGSQLLLEVLLR